MNVDYLIHTVQLFDGSGANPYIADVAIRGETIVAIDHDLSGCIPNAEHVIDGTGLSLAPGFIDAHTHSDAFVLIEPDAPSKITQGITTEICGQCGGSAAPRLNGAKLPSDWESQTYPRRLGHPEGLGPNWTTVADFRTCFEAAHPALNMILFAGHNTLRKGVTGDAPRPTSPSETATICRNLEQALDEGAWGFSTGLVYHPSLHATREEVMEIVRVCAKHGGHYATHMRSESDTILEAIDEVLAITRETGVATQISHLKVAGEKNWHNIDTVLERLNAIRTKGYHLYSDRYPYLSSGTDLDFILPEWASKGGNPVILPYLDNPQSAARIATDLNAVGHNPSSIMIGGTWSEQTHRFSGKTLAEVMQMTHKSFGEAIVSILKADRTRTGAFFFGMTEPNMHKILRQDWIMPGSDASLRAPWGPLSQDFPHPRAYGTFPRYFRLLVDELGQTPQEAIRRMTSLPAQAFKIPNRGLVKVGYAADLVLFDTSTFCDCATYTNPHQFSQGITTVFINGSPVFDHGIINPTAPHRGRFLTR